jgi:hypothetical protein
LSFRHSFLSSAVDLFVPLCLFRYSVYAYWVAACCASFTSAIILMYLRGGFLASLSSWALGLVCGEARFVPICFRHTFWSKGQARLALICLFLHSFRYIAEVRFVPLYHRRHSVWYIGETFFVPLCFLRYWICSSGEERFVPLCRIVFSLWSRNEADFVSILS